MRTGRPSWRPAAPEVARHVAPVCTKACALDASNGREQELHLGVAADGVGDRPQSWNAGIARSEELSRISSCQVKSSLKNVVSCPIFASIQRCRLKMSCRVATFAYNPRVP